MYESQLVLELQESRYTLIVAVSLVQCLSSVAVGRVKQKNCLFPHTQYKHSCHLLLLFAKEIHLLTFSTHLKHLKNQTNISPLFFSRSPILLFFCPLFIET